MTKFTALIDLLQRGVAHLKSHWKPWTAAAFTVALAGFELFADYLPLLAGAVGGWQLVVLTSVVSFAIAALRTKKRGKRASKRGATDAGSDS